MTRDHYYGAADGAMTNVGVSVEERGCERGWRPGGGRSRCVKLYPVKAAAPAASASTAAAAAAAARETDSSIDYLLNDKVLFGHM